MLQIDYSIFKYKPSSKEILDFKSYITNDPQWKYYTPERNVTLIKTVSIVFLVLGTLVLLSTGFAAIFQDTWLALGIGAFISLVFFIYGIKGLTSLKKLDNEKHWSSLYRTTHFVEQNSLLFYLNVPQNATLPEGFYFNQGSYGKPYVSQIIIKTESPYFEYGQLMLTTRQFQVIKTQAVIYSVIETAVHMPYLFVDLTPTAVNIGGLPLPKLSNQELTLSDSSKAKVYSNVVHDPMIMNKQFVDILTTLKNNGVEKIEFINNKAIVYKTGALNILDSEVHTNFGGLRTILSRI